MSNRTVALFAALTAFLGGPAFKGSLNTTPEPRRFDPEEQKRRRAERAERGRRRYGRWLRSGRRERVE